MSDVHSKQSICRGVISLNRASIVVDVNRRVAEKLGSCRAT
jgi:hypothetical protein